MTERVLSAALALVLAGGTVAAQSESIGAADAGMEGMDHSGMSMSADPALQPFADAMHGMMMGMPMESAGDVDADFLLMIPHHQSAIDMARVEIEQGDDEETRAMAQAIIDAQEAEIAEMRAMLERLGVQAPAAPAGQTGTTGDGGATSE
jgi:uncharacterized protein (DUF305 family)